MRRSIIKTGGYTITRIKKDRLNKFLKSKIYAIFYIIFTFYALFGDDIRHFVSSKKIDNIFYVIFILTFLFFVVDMILLTIKTTKKYFLSILFFLDLVGTFSLLLDIGWINEKIFQTTDMNVYGVLARGARSALLANSAFKYLEILRYIKTIRVSNLFSCIHKMKEELKKKKKKEKQRLKSYKILKNKTIQNIKKENPKQKKSVKDIYQFGKEMEQQKETTISNSGQEVSTLFTERTAILILILMCLLPIFYTESYYTRKLTSYETDLFTIQHYINSLNINQSDLLLKDKGFIDMWEEYKKVNKEDDYELLKLILFKNEDSSDSNNLDHKEHREMILKEYPAESQVRRSDIHDEFRYYEIRIFRTGQQGGYFFVSYFSIKKYLNIDALLNFSRTIFMLLLLFMSVYFYTVEMNDLLIEPLEKMMDNIFEINMNPIEAYKNIKKRKEEKNVKVKKVVEQNSAWGKQEMDELIEKLYKFCHLLSLGFGEAGNELIVKKLRGNNLSFKQGKKVMAIFGFCHIRNFSKYTEELRDEILDFINSIAYIVHSNVDKNYGKVNKNIGDTFLVVWKFDDEITEYLLLEEDKKIKVDPSHIKKYKNSIKKNCEFSIQSFIHTLISIKKKDHLKKLSLIQQKKQKNQKKTKKTKKYKNSKKTQNYNLQMSFGLHMGYAIEGAIGSNYKIDLSYLSPHVNLASRVMAATSQYNLNLLISDELVTNVSREFRNEFRIVDTVFLKGSKQAVQLYTFDLDFREKILSRLKKGRESLFREKEVLKKRQYLMMKSVFEKRINELEKKNDGLKKKEVFICRQVFNKTFFDRWNEGFRYYTEGGEGDWKKAHSIFFKLKTFINEVDDGPCVNLIEFIERNNYLPPENWIGVRSLLNK